MIFHNFGLTKFTLRFINWNILLFLQLSFLFSFFFLKRSFIIIWLREEDGLEDSKNFQKFENVVVLVIIIWLREGDGLEDSKIFSEI